MKITFILFFDNRGAVYKEFMTKDITINGQYNYGVLDWLLKWTGRVWPKPFCNHDFFILHENALVHTTSINQCLLADRWASAVAHPPYSPDLSLPDYFAFPKLKLELKDDYLNSINDIQTTVTAKLKRISQYTFKKALHDMQAWTHYCIEVAETIKNNV